MLGRRTLLAGVAAGLAMPAVAQPAKVIRFVPNTDLPVLDPVTNTATQVRNHGFLVYDTLYGLDTDFTPHPQMVAGHVVEEDGRQWTLTLREGLRFHDGAPVLARDCAASIRRWAGVDGFGATLMAATDELAAPDDRTLRFRLKKPFPLLPDALGRISPYMCAIMPERLAAEPHTKPVSEIIGSGPFRFLAAERVPGSLLAYAKFDAYVPAPGAPGMTDGGKHVHVDRVEWRIMPEAASATGALQTGEVDWLESPPPDLLPPLRQDRTLVVRVNDPSGVVPILRFNCLLPPFDNADIRRAVLSAVSQKEFMAAFSSDPANTRTGVGIFTPGTPMASAAGMDRVGCATPAQAAEAIKAAGYGGERVVMLEPTDHPVNSVMSEVGADLFKRLGLNVDDQAMDAATMFQRRGNMGDLAHGGWNCFPSAVGGPDVLNPAISFLARADGKKAWYGWPDDKALETLRLSWYDAPDRAAQKAIAARMQAETLAQALYLPLGQILQPTAYRAVVTGMLPGFAKFWGVEKG
jgi:peptide/nickel transport system substrate-binding protein